MVGPDRLRSLPLFNILREEERDAIADLVDETDVGSGAELTAQGDVGCRFFVIEHGQADVLVDGERVAGLGPGDFFGEVALMEAGRRSATVVSVSPMQLVTVGAESFDRIRADYPEVAERLEQAVRERRPVAQR